MITKMHCFFFSNEKSWSQSEDACAIASLAKEEKAALEPRAQEPTSYIAGNGDSFYTQV